MREHEIARTANEISDTAAREAFLTRTCAGDPTLRQKVETLLLPGVAENEATTIQAPDVPVEVPTVKDESSPGDAETLGEQPDHRAASLGDESTSPAETDDSTLDAGADVRTTEFGAIDPDGTRLPFTTEPEAGAGEPEIARAGFQRSRVIAGKYEILSILGEGGMGTVYRARQTRPVKRIVALKLIKTSMPSRTVLARFDAERQALALMDHPNIARVYDGGVTEANEPYFVMEMVEGEPITRFCDRNRLPLRARLELFTAVCAAVNHAHQKGIIHRDLKPGNVLVTRVDDRPTPKVIDFGVAKAIEVELTDISFTDTGMIVGTPSYMSPEQADPSSMNIDTRSDVYALGVILYELLVGSPPLDAAAFQRGAVFEMLRMVREVEPPRPSTRLRSAENLPNIAANRNTEPERLARSLQGELDWVVLKAIEKDRDRRYDSALSLARDLERFLADEVVEARPPSRMYRLRKFVRRHRGMVAAASLLFLALLAGVVGTSIGLLEAKRQKAYAEAGWAKAEENFASARALILSMGTQINQFESSQRDPKLADLARRRALEEARDQFDKFRKGNLDDESLQKQAALLHRYTATISLALSDYPAAGRAYAQALGITEDLRNRFPNSTVHRLDLALILSSRALLEMRIGKLREADETLAAAVRVAEEKQPETLATDQTRTLGLVDYDRSKIAYFRGNFDQSRRLAESSQKRLDSLSEAPFDRRQAYDSLFAVTAVNAVAKADRELGRLDDAILAHEEAVKRMKALAGAKPDRNQAHWLCETRLERARTAARFPDRRAAAADDLVEVAAIAQRQIDEYPQVAVYYEQMAAIQLCRGELLTLLGRYEPARAELAKSLAVSRVLLDRFGVLTGSMLVRGGTFLAIARNLALSGKAEEAETNRKNAQKVFEIAVKNDPENFHLQRGLREASEPLKPATR